MRELIEEHYQYMFRFARKMVGIYHCWGIDPKDIVHNIVMRLLAREIPPTIYALPQAYFGACVVREIKHTIRDRARKREVPLEDHIREVNELYSMDITGSLHDGVSAVRIMDKDDELLDTHLVMEAMTRIRPRYMEILKKQAEGTPLSVLAELYGMKYGSLRQTLVTEKAAAMKAYRKLRCEKRREKSFTMSKTY